MLSAPLEFLKQRFFSVFYLLFDNFGLFKSADWRFLNYLFDNNFDSRDSSKFWKTRKNILKSNFTIFKSLFIITNYQIVFSVRFLKQKGMNQSEFAFAAKAMIFENFFQTRKSISNSSASLLDHSYSREIRTRALTLNFVSLPFCSRSRTFLIFSEHFF